MKKVLLGFLFWAVIVCISACGTQPQTQFPAANTQPAAAQAVQTSDVQSTIYVQQPELYDVSVKVAYRENLAVNKYDAEIYIDEEYAGSIAQGKEKTISLSASAGQHTIKVIDVTDSTNHSSATFTVAASGNSFSFYIAATWSRIEISQNDSGDSNAVFTSAVSVNYRENIAANKYNINVYIDNQLLGEVEQGKTKMFATELSAGSHTIMVQEQGDSKNCESAAFTVKYDGYCYAFDCKAKWGGINISRGKDYQIG